VSAAAAGWAVWRRRTGARLTFTAASVGLVILRLDSSANQILGPSFLITFSLLVMSLLAAIGKQVQSARRAARAAELTSTRMEIELLKKNLQPHFLLNTLTALTEVVEQSPREAVKLIDDLAEELRSLSRMSAKKLIPLGQELELCRAHLRVMSLRTGKPWQLNAEDLDPASLVPPALFLTLIENGFTHQRIASTGGAFVLRRDNMPGNAMSFIFVSPGDIQDDPSRAAGGTGLRYVKARLEESFPGRWSFRQGPTSAGWESVIEIRNSA
jgi:LytS/YehU family sensor histidine kinase